MRVFLFIILSLFSLSLLAQYNDKISLDFTIDSGDIFINQDIVVDLKLEGKDKFINKLYLPTSFMVGSLLVSPLDKEIRSFRNDKLSDFSYGYDDYIVVSPAVIMLGLKAFGVESKNTWTKMIISDLASVAIMQGVAQTLKYTTNRLRPDGSNRYSFPSAHTATAFTCAHMLHKEYGHISPWISVAGYTLAGTTGVTRMLNNRHWFSDVVFGVGLGILSTELGYLITDSFYKDKKSKIKEHSYYPMIYLE